MSDMELLNIMSMWGVTEKGFYRPTIEEMKNAKNSIAKKVFGDDFDTDDLTPEGMMFRVNVAAQYKLIEIAEGTYYSIFHHTAKGVSLDRICEGINLPRAGEGYAEHLLKVYGTQGYIVEAGTEFKNPDGIEFYSFSNATITQEEKNGDTTIYYADVIVRCKESGTVGNINDITSTIENNENISNIVYSSVVTYGTDAESDPELREKYEQVVQGLGTNTKAAIIANVLRVPKANNCIIIDNNKAEDIVISDKLTIDGGSYAVVVYSDSTANEGEIAQAIYEKQPLGTPQSGIVECVVKDNSNTAHDVKFTYVETSNIDVVISCEVDSAFGTDGIQEIKDEITAYINGLGIGDEVVYTFLYNKIYGVTGVKKVTSMTINGGTEDIAISKIQIAKAGDIAVTIAG